MKTGHDLLLKLSEHKAEAKKRQSEEEEQREQREMDFQEELRRLIETEKVINSTLY